MILSCTASTERSKVEVYSYNSETNGKDSSVDDTDHFQTAVPFLVVNSQCLECTPETMSKVKPYSQDPSQINCNYNRIFEHCDNQF